MGDKRTDPGHYYPGGRVRAKSGTAPQELIVQWSDVQGKPQIAPLPDRYRDSDVKGKINEIASKFATAIAVALVGWTACAGLVVQKAPKDQVWNDEEIVTGVVYSAEAETDPVWNDQKSGYQPKIDDLDAIREGASKGATAVQVETDPTVADWAKKPNPAPVTDLTQATNYTDAVTNAIAAQYVEGDYTIVTNISIWDSTYTRKFSNYLLSHFSDDGRRFYTWSFTDKNADGSVTKSQKNATGNWQIERLGDIIGPIKAREPETKGATFGTLSANSISNVVTGAYIADRIAIPPTPQPEHTLTVNGTGITFNASADIRIDVPSTNGIAESVEIRQMWRDLELEAKTYLKGDDGKYYKLYVDTTEGSATAALDERGCTYEEIAWPYFFRYAQDYLGDVNAFVVRIDDPSKEYWMLRNGLGGSISWGDGTTSAYSGSTFYSHRYSAKGYYTISFKDNGLIWRANGTNIVTTVEPVAITKFASNVKYISYAFSKCTNIVGKVPPVHSPQNMNNAFAYLIGSLDVVENDADKTMPASVTSFANCVLGSSFGLRKRFFTSWGGTSGWTGEYYTSENAPVPELVGERIYDPIGNVNAFEIKIAPGDYEGDSFEFMMRIQSHGTDKQDIRVDWGDGTLTTYPAADVSSLTLVTHDYAKVGNGTNTYVICIDSGARNFRVGMADSSDDVKANVTRFISWSRTLLDARYVFYYCQNMRGEVAPWPVGVTICWNTFRQTKVFGRVPEWPSGLLSSGGCYGNTDVYGTLPEWPDGITSTTLTFQETKVSGLIPRWPSALTTATYCYKNCSNLTGFESGMTIDDICPDGVSGDQAYYGCLPSVRDQAYVSWGGTIPNPE